MSTDIQNSPSERPAFTGRRPVVDSSGHVVGVESFSVAPLPAEIITMIFGKFSVRYMKKWADEIASVGDEDALRGEWRRELAGSDLKSIKWALENLPEFPPNCAQFRAIVRRAPSQSHQEAPPPKRGKLTDAERDALSMLKGRVRGISMENERARIEALKKQGIVSEAVACSCATIPLDVLPPGMRNDISGGKVNYFDKANRRQANVR